VRIGQFESSSRGPLVGVAIDGGVASSPFRSIDEVIAGGDEARQQLVSIAAEGQADPDLGSPLAPLQRPSKMLFSGVNYADHAKDAPSGSIPNEPFFFSKLSSSIIGDGDSIIIPRQDLQIDYEVELAVILGTRLVGADTIAAARAVFGYTVVNDVSARAIQFKDQQITLGKNLDTFCPMGPWVLVADSELDIGRLRVSCSVNGEVRQSATVSQLIFAVPELLAFLSQHMTLEPGDLVATGTPSGVGFGMSPQTFLQPGDEVVTEISEIGRLTNPVVAATLVAGLS
jgi:2,4-diketo-3-deoxy-L-fuconate hydrolase